MTVHNVEHFGLAVGLSHAARDNAAASLLIGMWHGSVHRAGHTPFADPSVRWVEGWRVQLEHPEHASKVPDPERMDLALVSGPVVAGFAGS